MIWTRRSYEGFRMKSTLHHRFYIDEAIKNIDKALDDLRVSADDSDNPLVRAVINNIEQQKALLAPNKHQLF